MAVYTNEETGVASVGLRNALLDRLVGAPPIDWGAAMAKRLADKRKDALKTLGAAPRPAPSGPTLPLDAMPAVIAIPVIATSWSRGGAAA